MESVLSKNYIGEFSMTVGNLSCSTRARPRSKLGLEMIEKSVKAKGWLSQFSPSVLIACEHVPDGIVTPELALSLKARVLDGNHRVVVFTKLFGGSATLKVRLYYNFVNGPNESVIANCLNDASESLAKRTVYDKLYFFSHLFQPVMNLTKKKDVGPADLKNAFTQVGAKPPSDQHLINMKKALTNLSAKAFKAIRELSEHASTSNIDSNAITIAYLSRKEFGALQDRPTQQAICVQLLARFKGRFGKGPKGPDFDAIELQASRSATVVDSVEAMIPEEDWSDHLRKEVEKITYKKRGVYELVVRPHVESIEEMLASTNANLPHDKALVSSITTVLRQKPLQLIREIFVEDANLRPLLQKWDESYQEALSRVTWIKLCHGLTPLFLKPKPRDDDDDNDDGDRDGKDGDGYSSPAPKQGSRNGQLCTSCKPPATSRYYCVECLITHCGSCAKASPAENDQPETNNIRRVCTACQPANTSGFRAKRGRRNVGDEDESLDLDGEWETTPRKNKKARNPAGGGLLTTLSGPAGIRGLDKVVIDAAGRENMDLHDILLLAPETPCKTLDSLALKRPAMLAVVSIAADKSLLQETKVAHDRLAKIIEAVQRCLHPCGSMALFVPRPWKQHYPRLIDAAERWGTAMSVEEEHLILQYSIRSGDRPAVSETNHMRRGSDMLLIAHHTSSGKAFTCNPRVTVDDVYGQRNNDGPAPVVLQIMNGVPFAGAGMDIPKMALQFLVNRFTRPGDTVVSICGESNRAIEVSLNLARRVEVFLADRASEEGVKKRMEDAFLAAYEEGKFKASSVSTAEPLIGPNRTPQDLRSDPHPQASKGPTNKDTASEIGASAAESVGCTIEGGNMDLDVRIKHEPSPKPPPTADDTTCNTRS